MVGFNGGTLGFIRGCVFESLKVRRTCKNAVFYVHGHVSTLPAYFALRGLPSARLVYHTQDYIEPGRHAMWEFFEKRFIRRAGNVISNEPNRARFLASHYGLKQLPTVVPTALPRDWPRPERDLQLRQAILARLGRHDSDTCRLIMNEGPFTPIRCSRELVEAFQYLPDDFILVFTGVTTGSASEREARHHVEQYGLQRRVVLLERFDFQELLHHTACCDGGILLYPNDGVGNYYQAPGRLTHYIGCGLPIVASNFPGLELLALKHNLGAVCDPTSPQSIAEAIRKIAGRSMVELAEHGRTLKLLARNELSYEAHAWRIEKILNQASPAKSTLCPT